MSGILEIACFNTESCRIAQNSGADRIEFCSNYAEGGITPSREEIIKARQLLKIPLWVMIRVRGGNFVFTNEEKEKMKTAVSFCKAQQVDGIVTGALTVENKIDTAFLKELIFLAAPLTVTFHRAVDKCENLNEALQMLIDMGVKRVLTSGGSKTAMEGKHKLQEWQLKFGNKIIVLPGGGIRSANIMEIMDFTGCNEFHSAAITNGSELADAGEISKLKVSLAQ